MKRVRSAQTGFTLIELMVVTLIIGILVVIALPNFASMTDRARIAGIKSNAHTLQVVIESDAVPRGQYAASVSELTGSDAYKVFTNPLTSNVGPGLPGNGAWYMSTDGASDGAALPGGFTGGRGAIGEVVYVPVNAQGDAVGTAGGTRNAAAGAATAYMIFGVGPDAKPIKRFLMANGFANGDVPANALGLIP
jgi:prepilin-type N-terminal cleavage/methylation domain-containing protein